MDYNILDLEKHGDDRGMLIALEGRKNIPFEIKRIYYMFHTMQKARRGYHSHKNLEQVLVCIYGSCKILLDDSYARETIVLDNPFKGLYIKSNMWREMYDFSEDAILMVVASEHYDEEDYIRNYDDFFAHARGQNGDSV